MDSYKQLPFAESEPVWDHLRWNSYLSLQHKLLYVATPKVACTTLKWWFASLEGCVDAVIAHGGSQETNPDLIIHDTFHLVAPQVTGLPPGELSEALNSETHFRFAVVRNPFRRIFSAWQSKILLREPLQMGVYAYVDDVNRSIENLDDITVAFEQFLEHVAANQASSARDVHFIPQVEILRPDLINYSALSGIEDTSALCVELEKWLGPSYVDPFVEMHANESLLPYLPRFVSTRSRELILSIYADDFEQFGYELNPPTSKARISVPQFKIALRAIRMLRGRHERLADIKSDYQTKLTTLANDSAAQINQLNCAIGEYKDELINTKSDWDARATQLESALLDRNTRLDQLNEGLAQQSNEVRRLETELQESRHEQDRTKYELEAKAAELEDARLESDARIMDLNESLLRQVEQERRLKTALQERRDELNGLRIEWQALEAELHRALQSRGVEARGRKESLSEYAEQEDRLDSVMQEGRRGLERLISEWEAREAELERELKDRESTANKLQESLAEKAERERRLHAASEEIRFKLIWLKSEWEARVNKLEHVQRDQETKIKELEGSLAERDSQIGDMKEQLDAKEDELEESHQLLNESSINLERLIKAKEEVEDMNRRMQDTTVWRLARKLGLVKMPIAGDGIYQGMSSKHTKGFDAEWYQNEYPDIAASGMDPHEHYVTSGKAEGRLPYPPRHRSSRLRNARRWYSGLMSAIRQVGGVRKAFGKVVTVAKRDGWFVDDFDEEFYLRMYPDIREAGVDPYEHFVQHGRSEGRIGRRPNLLLQKGSVRWDPKKKAVLVVSHEVSRTGAPILSLNIAKELQKQFNVVVLTLGDGAMLEAFLEVVPVLAGPMLVRGSVDMAGSVVAQLAQEHDFEFAIVNSIESRFVLKELTLLSIPTISLIHEFAAYTRPMDAFRFAIRWSAETVFSAQITHDNALDENPELTDQPLHIIPQGRSTMLARAGDVERVAFERERVLRILRPRGDADKDTIVIVGVGYVQYRKGVDLFLECAARVIHSKGGERCRFVWIGNGYDPVADMAYSAYLSEQVKRSGLQSQFTFMKSTSAIEQVYKSADILLLSSRLDPLPNVALDAMAHSLPLVCFANTTGVVDALVDCGLTDNCVAPYLDTAAMAGLVLDLAKSKDLRIRVGKCLRETVEEKFNMERYVARLEELAEVAALRLANEEVSAKLIQESKLIRPDFFLRPHDEHVSPEYMVRYGYVRGWASGTDKRKPYPGFHPEIFREQYGEDEPGMDPLASYIRAGKPDGPWCFEVISSNEELTKLPKKFRVALHLHAYFPELIGEILERLGHNSVKPDLFISVPDENAAEVVRKAAKKYSKQVIKMEVVPNVGRDLGPFFTEFGRILVDQYDVVGHLHTKKSVDIADSNTGKVWNQFLMENLLGGKAKMADIILGRMARDSSIGLVFPDDPHVVGWGANLPYAKKLGAKLGLDDFPKNLAFPVGSMFWARTDAVRPFVDLGLDWVDYPKEPLPYDGSMLHAIERMLPLVAKKQSTRVVLTNVIGVTR